MEKRKEMKREEGIIRKKRKERNDNGVIVQPPSVKAGCKEISYRALHVETHREQLVYRQ